MDSGKREEEDRQGMQAKAIRTCLGCQKRLPKSGLLKFVLENGTVVFDHKGRGSGRSVYCCNDKSCFRNFCKQKKKLSRALRVQDCQISVELKDWE
jgi:predicted RNA-binding protein YlxR (DUF448 family)